MYQGYVSGALADSHRTDLVAAADRYRRDQLAGGGRRWGRRAIAHAAAAVRRKPAVAPGAALLARPAR